jgi:hypothetical protein
MAIDYYFVVIGAIFYYDRDFQFQVRIFIKVRSTARHAIHFHFNIRANALAIRAVQCPKSDVLLTLPVIISILIISSFISLQ